jgi:hypothetical protein
MDKLTRLAFFVHDAQQFLNEYVYSCVPFEMKWDPFRYLSSAASMRNNVMTSGDRRCSYSPIL